MKMRKAYTFLMSLGFAVALSACGKGIDAKLATDSESAYRASLNKAWQDMNAEQQKAFNWAVSNFSLEQLIAKYPSMTPRQVVDREADEYIKFKTQALAEATANLAKNSVRLAQEEQIVREVEAELAKITATGLEIKEKSFGFGKEFVFATNNGSSFDVSTASWNAWLFLDDEQTSDRHCSLNGYYKVHGGLPRGKSLKYSVDIGFMDCRNWDTLEVRNAKRKQFKLELVNSSVKNFGEKAVLPEFSPTRASYESAIKAAKDEIQVGQNAKATLQQ